MPPWTSCLTLQHQGVSFHCIISFILVLTVRVQYLLSCLIVTQDLKAFFLARVWQGGRGVSSFQLVSEAQIPVQLGCVTGIGTAHVIPYQSSPFSQYSPEISEKASRCGPQFTWLFFFGFFFLSLAIYLHCSRLATTTTLNNSSSSSSS